MIASATQQGNIVYVYNERGGVIFTRPGTLMGFTSTTVTIKVGNIANVYDENGQLKFTRPTN